MSRASAICWVIAAACLGAASVRVEAQRPATPQASNAQTATPAAEDAFRRVFVPVERAAEWPVDSSRRLPVNREEFARFVAASKARAGLVEAGAPYLRSAVYRAKLDADRNLTGTAQLEVAVADASPRLLPLAPWNVATSAARWSGSDQPPLLGSWTRPKGSSVYGVIAARSDRLTIDWQATPSLDSPAAVEFELALPSATTTRLALDLPRGATPTLTPGTLVGVPAETARGRRVWTFQLPAGEKLRLQIHGAGIPADRQTRTPALASTTEEYRLTPRGLNYELAVRVDGADEQGSLLRGTADGSLEITAATVDGIAAKWERGAEGPGVFYVPIAPGAGPRIVRVTAVSRLELDRPWRLPRIRLEGLQWSEGTAALWIDPRLRLESITPQGASLQNIVGIGEGQATGEVYRLQALTEEGGAEVVLGQLAPRLRTRSATSIELTGPEAIGRVVMEAWAEEGEVYQATLDLEPGWTLDDVEATPADTLAEWHVGSNDAGSQLHLQFHGSPTAATPITITATGRRSLAEPDAPVTAGELLWLRSQLVASNENLLFVKGKRGSEVIPDPPLLGVLRTADSLSNDERRLVGDVAGGLLFAADEAPRDAAIRTAVRAPTFEADGRFEVALTLAGFRHRAEIECRPTLGALGEATVTFARPLPEEAEWSLAGSRERLVVDRLPKAAAGAAGQTPDAGWDYRVRLPRPYATPFQLTVEWDAERRDAEPINAAVMRGAAIWHAWSILRGDPTRATADGAGCVPASPPNDGPTTAETVLGCFRLSDDPAAAFAALPQPKMIVAAGGQGLPRPQPICWYADVATRVFADGKRLHWIRYDLEPRGASELELRPAAGSSLVAVRVDDAESPVETTGADKDAIRLRLPSDRRRVTLAVELTTTGDAPEFSAAVDFPNVGLSIPVFRGRWSTWAPADYASPGEDALGAGGVATRLFGPLAGGAEARPFNPASGDDWRKLVESLGGDNEDDKSTSAASELASSAIGAMQAPKSAPALTGPPTFRREFVAVPKSVTLYSIRGRQAAWATVLLIAAAIAARRTAPAASWGAAAGVLAIGCLVAPIPWVWLPQAALLGMAAGIAVRKIVAPAQRMDRGRRGGALRLTAATATVLVVLLVASLGRGEATAPAVLFPVDADGHPAGSDVYVPEELLERLSQSTRGDDVDGAEATLVDAHYRLGFSEGEAGGAAQPRISLSFRWQTHRRGVRCELPLAQSDVKRLANRVEIDGAPGKVAWNKTGKGCVVAFDEPGLHELQMEAAPQVEADGRRRRLKIHIPPLAGARVDAASPFEASPLRVLDSVQLADQPSKDRVISILSATPELVAEWTASSAATAASFTAEQLAWLRLEPAAGRLDVQVRLAGEGPPLAMVELELSPELKLAPLPADSEIQEVETFPGSPTVVQLKFRQPAALPLAFSIPLELQRSVSFGRIEMPQVRVRGATAEKRLFVASVGKGLRMREHVGTGLRLASTEEIETAWGVAPEAADLKYSVVTTAPEWSADVEPAPPRFSVSEQMELELSIDHARVHYAATVASVEGELLVHRFVVDRGLTVEQVEATMDDGTVIPMRWGRPESEKLVAFLGTPASGPHTVRIVGRITANEGSIATPRIEIDGGGALESRLVVRRDAGTIGNRAPSVGGASPAGVPSEEDVAAGLVGRFVIPRGQTPPTFEVEANNALYAADTAVMLTTTGGRAEATYVIHGRVTQGILDRVRIYASKTWQGPLRATPASKVSTRDAVYDPLRQVVEIELSEPVAAGKSFDLRVSGTIRPAARESLAAPQFRLLNTATERKWVIVPPPQAEQSVEWALGGLELSPLPARLDAAAAAATGSTSYLAVRDTYVAEQRVFPRALRRPTARVAEIHGVIDSQGWLAATAQIVVQPGPATELAVPAPAGAELASVASDGQSAIDKSQAGASWPTRAAARFLPRALVVAYRQKVEHDGDGLVLRAPEVLIGGEPVAIDSCVWHIESAADATVSSPDGFPLPSTGYAAVAEADRLSALAEAAPLALQLPMWELRNWLAAWRNELPSEAARDNDAWKVWRNLWESAGEASGISAVDGDGGAKSPAADSKTVILRGRRGDGTAVVSLDAASSDNLVRWLGALAIAGVLVTARRFPAPLKATAEWLRARPHGVAATVGLFWWALLQPSAIGLVIAGLAALSWLRRDKLRGFREAPSRASAPAATPLP